jgi:arsenate reductase
MKKKPKVAFLCMHNSYRSRVAEALAREYASDAFEAYSAGSEPPHAVDDRVAWMLLEYCSCDITENDTRPLSELPRVDIVITMGKEDSCPDIPCSYTENWGLEDSGGRADPDYRKMIETVRSNVMDLRDRIKRGKISPICEKA